LESRGLVVSGGSIEELVGRLPADAVVSVGLDSADVLVSLFRLPAAEGEELRGMVSMQLEKVLPFPVEEVVFDAVVVESIAAGDAGEGGEDREVASISVPLGSVEEACGILRERGVRIGAVGVYAEELGFRWRGAGEVLAFWMESGRLVVGLYRGGALVWADTFAVPDGDAAAGYLEEELARRLVSAEFAGMSWSGCRLMVGAGAELIRTTVERIFGRISEGFEVGLTEPVRGAFKPASWAAAESQEQNRNRVQAGLQRVVMAYLMVILGFVGYLAFLKRKANGLEQRIQSLQPVVAETREREQRWRGLAPAIEPERMLIEVLNQINQARTSEEVRITEFTSSPQEFILAGEASSYAEAVDYTEKLKGSADLSRNFQLTAGNPQILPNERAQFRITGREEAKGRKTAGKGGAQ
jgi:hypothetical protein